MGEKMAESKYVVFKVAEEFYGIQIERVERILPEQDITKLPKMSKLLLGIFNLRGETLAAVDLRARFELPAGEGLGNYIVVQTDHGRCALHVDGVVGISMIEEENVDEHAILQQQSGDGFITGIAKTPDRLVALLEPDELLTPTLRTEVAKVSAA